MEGSELIDPKDMSDHDLLVRTVTLVEVIRTGHDNHLEHHRRHDLAMLSVTIGSLFTALIAIGCAIIAYMK